MGKHFCGMSSVGAVKHTWSSRVSWWWGQGQVVGRMMGAALLAPSHCVPLFSSVCGLSVHRAAHAAAAHLLDRTGPRAHQHHGLHQHLLLAGGVSPCLPPRAWAGCPRHLPQQPISKQASACAWCSWRAWLQYHRPIQVHQQGPSVLRLLCVWGHLLRGVHHTGLAGLSHPLPSGATWVWWTSWAWPVGSPLSPLELSLYRCSKSSTSTGEMNKSNVKTD